MRSKRPQVRQAHCSAMQLSLLKFTKTPHVLDCGDVEKRRKLRRELKCHNFDWYLSNVYPEMQLPRQDDLSFGQIHYFTQGTAKCLDGVGEADVCFQFFKSFITSLHCFTPALGREGVIGGNSCLQTYPPQQFRMSSEGLILQDDFCLALTEIKPGAQVSSQL